MIDEIDPIEPVSKKRKIPDLQVWNYHTPVYTGSLLPYHFQQLILTGNQEVVKTSSENTFRNRLEMRKWRIEDEKLDVWKRLEQARNYNSLLNRVVVFIR